MTNNFISEKFFYPVSLVVLFLLTGNSFLPEEENKIEHKVKVSHPGKAEKFLNELIEVTNKEHFPVEYYMDVVSVYCHDSVCKVVPVQIYWNAIGMYSHYELTDGVILEKDEGKPFTPSDYEKLHRILHDKNSPFKEIHIAEIFDSGSTEGTDALSGATVVSLGNDETVEGATLTCYTLWHWANGEIVKIIREITGNRCTPEVFIDFLNKKDRQHKKFVMEQVIRRNLADPELSKEIVQHATGNFDWELFKLTIEYLELTDNGVYFSSLKKLFFSGKKEQKTDVLNSLIETNKTPPSGYFNSFWNYLPITDSYQQINLLFLMAAKKGLSNDLLNEKAILLLDKEIIIARRAFWFLKEQELNKRQEKKVSKFYRNHKEFL